MAADSPLEKFLATIPDAVYEAGDSSLPANEQWNKGVKVGRAKMRDQIRGILASGKQAHDGSDDVDE